MYMFIAFRHLHGDVLQRVVRQVRDKTDVWLLPQLGSRVGLQEERYIGRNKALLRGHHWLTGNLLQSYVNLLLKSKHSKKIPEKYSS